MPQTDGSPAWEDLTFASNFLFCKIMESEPELCRRILEMLLHIKITKLKKTIAERTMIETLNSKSVRFDVYTRAEPSKSFSMRQIMLKWKAAKKRPFSNFLPVKKQKANLQNRLKKKFPSQKRT